MSDKPSLEKMALLGSLMAGLAHEVNTPLAAIRSNGEILGHAFQRLEEFVQALPEADGTRPVDAVQDLLILIRDALHTNQLACDRLVFLASGVRNFARADDATFKKAAIDQIIENALTLVAHQLRGRIVVHKDFGKVAEVDCYPNQLSQVFINILVNAAQAIEGNGEIRIKTWQEGDLVHVSISDTGGGMPAEIQSRIFQSGFTTKEQGLGTGLGLALCLKTLQNHGGRIEVQSQPGQGSTFMIVLPVIQISERKMDGEE